MQPVEASSFQIIIPIKNVFSFAKKIDNKNWKKNACVTRKFFREESAGK